MGKVAFPYDPFQNADLRTTEHFLERYDPDRHGIPNNEMYGVKGEPLILGLRGFDPAFHVRQYNVYDKLAFMISYYCTLFPDASGTNAHCMRKHHEEALPLHLQPIKCKVKTVA